MTNTASFASAIRTAQPGWIFNVAIGVLALCVLAVWLLFGNLFYIGFTFLLLSLSLWAAVILLGLMLFWPIGLALLAYMVWNVYFGDKSRAERRSNRVYDRTQMRAPNGNTAFDEYREETLRRLEEEQNEFSSFLEHLRKARDKAEFDQFMSDRNRQTPPEPDDVPTVSQGK